MTKQLNKKGTSLVELIAVIVIMGIIAGIAIPTTIAVINRQKKNAAVKSAENVFTAAKELLLEAQSTGVVDGVTANTSTSDTTWTFETSAAAMVTSGDLEKNPCDSGATLTIRINAQNKFSVVESSISINKVTVYFNATTQEFTTSNPSGSSSQTTAAH